MENTLLGKFSVTRRLGRGGMGAVYQGYDAALDRRVAIKTLTSITDSDSRERFEREARAAAKLQHPNIVTMYELGNFGKTERPYIVMEFLDGTDLAKAIREEPAMPLSEILDVAVQLCRALDFAHRHGVVHRDMKPANVRYLDNGQIKIMDFGIARLEGSKTLTEKGMMVGTLQYMSPEQIRGKALDGRSDLFSLGCIIYEMLCGDRAFEGDSATSILYSIAHDEPTPILDKNPDLPQELDGILRRAMSKEADDRYPSGEAMALDLEKLAAIHRKASTWSRPDIQKHQEELEEFRRGGNWDAVLEKASAMLDRDPNAVAPYRALRQARRMLALRSSPEDSSPEAERERLDVSREISQLYGVDLPTLPDQPLHQQLPPSEIGADPESEATRNNLWVVAIPLVAVVVAAVAIFWPSSDRPSPSAEAAPETAAESSPGPPAEAGSPGEVSPPSPPSEASGDLADRLEHRLGIVAEPAGAAIAVNGRDTGVTTRDGRVTIPLTGVAGDAFTIRLSRSGFGTVEKEIVLGKQAPEDWNVRMSARVSSIELVSDPPGATIELDGTALEGETPMVIDWTAGRSHQLTVAKEGYATRTLSLSSGERPPAPITLNRVRRNGSVRVVTDYPVAVTLGGREIIALGAAERASVPSGSHQLTLVAPDVFLRRTVPVDVGEDQEVPIPAPALGRISIRANPGRCEIRIGDFDAGPAPIQNRQIVAGSHKITFVWPDGATSEETATIQAGRPAYVIGQKP